MRSPLRVAVLLLVAAVLPGCFAGPHYLRRSFDDFDQRLYQESPVVDGILWFPIPAIPLATSLAFLGDLFVDGYAFWFQDLWAGQGTGFVHADQPSERRIRSFIREDSGFLKFEGH